MFNVSFELDADRLKQSIKNNLRDFAQQLRERLDKTFPIVVDDQTHIIRYEIDNEDTVQLFVERPEGDAKQLIIPDLNLNIGELLLPESMALTDSGVGYNPNPVYTPYKEMGYNRLPDNDLRKIYDRIRETGLVNLVKK